MATLVNPENKSARKALKHEVQPPLYDAAVYIAGWGTGLGLAVLIGWLTFIIPPPLIVLVGIVGFIASSIAGMAAAMGAWTMLENRDKRLAARYRSQGEIIDVPNDIIRMWRDALTEGHMPLNEPLSQPEAHFSFFASLMVYHEARAGASEQRKQQLVARIQERISVKAAEIIAEVQFAIAAKEDTTQLETEAHDEFVKRLLGLEE